MSTSKKVSGWKLVLAGIVGALALTAVAAPASAFEGHGELGRGGYGRFERGHGPVRRGGWFGGLHDRRACAPLRGRGWHRW